MPSMQVVDFTPSPRTEPTSLEQTLSAFSNRNRQNQLEQQESDALSSIYKQYQDDGRKLEDAIMAIQTRPGISPTTRVNSVNQLLSMQKHNADLQENALKKQKAETKADLDRRKSNQIAKDRGLPEEYDVGAFQDDPNLLSQITKPADDKRLLDEKQKVNGLESALKRLDRMDQIRKKGNVGRGSSIPGVFGGETARDRAEYSQLGKSLISFASTIPIRNQMEFETLAHDLYDPNKTLAEMEGTIKAMRAILTQSINEINPEYNQNQANPSQQNVKEKPPLSSFKR